MTPHLFGQSLGQIFGGLSLPGSSRTFGSSSQVQLQSSHQCSVVTQTNTHTQARLHVSTCMDSGEEADETALDLEEPVAAVGEGCDHQPRGVAQVLVAVLQVGGDHAQHDLVLLPEVAQLGDPGEVVEGGDAILGQYGHNIPS